MPTVRGQFAQLLAPGLAEVMLSYLKEFPEEYSQFLNVSTMDSAYDEDQLLAGTGLARLKPEGESIAYDEPIQGGTKRYIAVAYAIGWSVTREMIKDDRYGIMREIPGELMKGCRQTWEQIGANLLNLGFTTVTSIDGLPAFSAVHDLLGGGTASNLLSPATTLSVTAVQDILLLYEGTVNERGLKMRISPDTLWIPPDLQFKAAEIFQSSFKPYTGNNEINPIQGRLTPKVLHFLTDTNNWFVSSKELNKFKLKWREKPVVDSTDDFDTKGSKHSIYFRIAANVGEWRGWAASNP